MDLEKRKARVLDKQRAFRIMSRNAIGRLALRDLAQFCCATESTVEGLPIDPNKALVLEGRRQVWLRIQKYLQLTEAELWALTLGEP